MPSAAPPNRRATIVGAGQGGLHLALGLLADGWSVRVISDRTPEQCLAMNALASHTLQQRAISKEREAGIDLYEHLVDHRMIGVDFSLTTDGQHVALHFQGDFEAPATAVDTRLKYARLLEAFARRGGSVVYRSATLADLEELTERGEAIFVATGKAGLADRFALDEQRTVYDRPQRQLMLVLADGLKLRHPDLERRIIFSFHAEQGEIFFGP